MTRGNLIFLGACALRSQGTIIQAIEDATRLYDKVHGKPGKPEEWEVQVYLSRGWTRSIDLRNTFSSRALAEKAMGLYSIPPMEYRAHKVDGF